MEAIVSQADANKKQEKWTIRQKLVGIIVSPRQTFEYLVKNPDWLTPMALISLATMILTLITFNEASIRISAQNDFSPNAKITTIITVFLTFVAPLFTVLSWITTTGIIFILARIVLGRVNFRSFISIFGYANIPLILKSILLAGSIIVTGRYLFKPGLSGLFADYRRGFLYAFLANVDIFIFWNLLLSVLGISILYKSSKVKAAIVALTPWLIGIVFEGLWSRAWIF